MKQTNDTNISRRSNARNNAAISTQYQETQSVLSLIWQLLKALFVKGSRETGQWLEVQKKTPSHPLIGYVKVFALCTVSYFVFFESFGFNMLGATAGSSTQEAGFWSGAGSEGGQRSKSDESEFAPADLSELKGSRNTQYINEYKALAIAEMERTGIPASITLAQGIIESRSGDSRLCKQLRNHFGMKCFSKKCGEGHCKNFTDDHHKDFFLNFKSAEACFKAHSKLLQNPRYLGRAGKNADYKEWAWALQKGGYATGSQYAKKLINVIERYELQKLDINGGSFFSFL